MLKTIFLPFLMSNLIPILAVVSLGLGGFWVFNKIESWGLKSKIEKQEQLISGLNINFGKIQTANEALAASVKMQNELISAWKINDTKDRKTTATLVGQVREQLRQTTDSIKNSPTVKIDVTKSACENSESAAIQFFNTRPK